MQAASYLWTASPPPYTPPALRCTELQKIEEAENLPKLNETYVKVDPKKQAIQNAELDLMSKEQSAKKAERCRCDTCTYAFA